MEDRIHTIIHDWLNTTFKNPNAMPEIMIKGLAEEINKHRWEIYNFVQEEYDMEDIEMIAQSNNINLNGKEMREVLRRYQNRDSNSLDELSFIIDNTVASREIKSLSSSSTQGAQ